MQAFKTLLKKYPRPVHQFPSANNSISISFGHADPPSAAIIGTQAQSFTPNPKFESILQSAIKSSVLQCPAHQNLAELTKNGFMHINDERVASIWGRVNDPEDIFGTVLVNDGKIMKDTYEAMPTHRLVSPNGLFQLNDFMHKHLLSNFNE